jgi:hypothetical protein
VVYGWWFLWNCIGFVLLGMCWWWICDLDLAWMFWRSWVLGFVYWPAGQAQIHGLTGLTCRHRHG